MVSFYTGEKTLFLSTAVLPQPAIKHVDRTKGVQKTDMSKT